jgi:hypothetical protein
VSARLVKDAAYRAAVQRAADRIGPVPPDVLDKVARIVRGPSGDEYADPARRQRDVRAAEAAAVATARERAHEGAR